LSWPTGRRISNILKPRRLRRTREMYAIFRRDFFTEEDRCKQKIPTHRVVPISRGPPGGRLGFRVDPGIPGSPDDTRRDAPGFLRPTCPVNRVPPLLVQGSTRPPAGSPSFPGGPSGFSPPSSLPHGPSRWSVPLVGRPSLGSPSDRLLDVGILGVSSVGGPSGPFLRVLPPPPLSYLSLPPALSLLFLPTLAVP
jgi:hypothetical protein